MCPNPHPKWSRWEHRTIYCVTAIRRAEKPTRCAEYLNSGLFFQLVIFGFVLIVGTRLRGRREESRRYVYSPGVRNCARVFFECFFLVSSRIYGYRPIIAGRKENRRKIKIRRIRAENLHRSRSQTTTPNPSLGEFGRVLRSRS